MTTGTHRRALEEALDAAPDDTATRLVLADLCEEEGEWEWAAVHRVRAARVTDANFSPPVKAMVFPSSSLRRATLPGVELPQEWTILVHGQYERGEYYSYRWTTTQTRWQRYRPAPFGDPWQQRARPSPSVRAAVEAAGFQALRRLSTPAR